MSFNFNGVYEISDNLLTIFPYLSKIFLFLQELFSKIILDFLLAYLLLVTIFFTLSLSFLLDIFSRN